MQIGSEREGETSVRQTRMSGHLETYRNPTVIGLTQLDPDSYLARPLATPLIHS
jgi:hypothetical protein